MSWQKYLDIGGCRCYRQMFDDVGVTLVVTPTLVSLDARHYSETETCCQQVLEETYEGDALVFVNARVAGLVEQVRRVHASHVQGLN